MLLVEIPVASWEVTIHISMLAAFHLRRQQQEIPSWLLQSVRYRAYLFRLCLACYLVPRIMNLASHTVPRRSKRFVLTAIVDRRTIPMKRKWVTWMVRLTAMKGFLTYGCIPRFLKLFIEDYNLQYVQYTRRKLQNCSGHQFNWNEFMDQKL
jgi:hypothetical protein